MLVKILFVIVTVSAASCGKKGDNTQFTKDITLRDIRDSAQGKIPSYTVYRVRQKDNKARIDDQVILAKCEDLTLDCTRNADPSPKVIGILSYKDYVGSLALFFDTIPDYVLREDGEAYLDKMMEIALDSEKGIVSEQDRKNGKPSHYQNLIDLHQKFLKMKAILKFLEKEAAVKEVPSNMNAYNDTLLPFNAAKISGTFGEGYFFELVTKTRFRVASSNSAFSETSRACDKKQGEDIMTSADLVKLRVDSWYKNSALMEMFKKNRVEEIGFWTSTNAGSGPHPTIAYRSVASGQFVKITSASMQLKPEVEVSGPYDHYGELKVLMSNLPFSNEILYSSLRAKVPGSHAIVCVKK